MDVKLNITIPDAHTAQVLNAFTKGAEARIDLNAHKSTETTDFNANWAYSYDKQGDSETAKEFAIRVILSQIKAFVRMVDLAEDQDRYRTEVSAITPASQDIEDGIITGA